ncbi:MULTISPECIES: DUF1127 domain-containing protein [Roseobacteraceae]|uniref:DUF1127 domain-containing protein n=1 Tax=Roseobacteraceae TaxID=2854170 RepID=UPI001C4450BF|nr:MULTISPECIES: DUF1127 domain-containing protein [Roseobacteraceae]MBV7408971.1 DUF1127 domain-containing protein [Maritimibacter sp. DP1N21-5]MBY5934342.1 DUF1127 domain-containing protein [Tateyamaria omphalii]
MALTDVNARTVTGKPHDRRSFSLHTLFNVWKSRRALARLDARGLEDIGLNANMAARESAKPIWDVPATWRD